MAMMRKEHRSPFNEDACDPAAHGAWGGDGSGERRRLGSRIPPPLDMRRRLHVSPV
jgi:hypothetical protein